MNNSKMIHQSFKTSDDEMKGLFVFGNVCLVDAAGVIHSNLSYPWRANARSPPAAAFETNRARIDLASFETSKSFVCLRCFPNTIIGWAKVLGRTSTPDKSITTIAACARDESRCLALSLCDETGKKKAPRVIRHKRGQKERDGLSQNRIRVSETLAL